MGTSLSDQHLDVKKIETETSTHVSKLTAFTITRKEGRKNPNVNAEELIPATLACNKVDLLVIEIGVNEISNLDINKEHNQLMKEIRCQTEKLFHLAIQYTADYPNLKAVLLNRLPRLDSTTRADLGREMDREMSKLWEENGKPTNIILESLQLQVGSQEEKEEVFGRHLGTKSYGIHLRGVAGSKEFSYRAARLLLKVLGKAVKEGNKETGARMKQYDTTLSRKRRYEQLEPRGRMTGATGSLCRKTGGTGSPCRRAGGTGSPCMRSGGTQSRWRRAGATGSPCMKTGGIGSPSRKAGCTGSPCRRTGGTWSPGRRAGDTGSP